MFRFDLVLTINCLAAIGLSGCTKDMAVQPKYQVEGPSSFFADGRMMRPPLAGTVAIDEPNPKDVAETGAGVKKIPFDVTADFLHEGQVRYNIFCTACHDRTGEGHGIVVQRGFQKPESLLSEALRAQADGQIFQTITSGKGSMASYRSQIPVEQRWAIVAYVRALQLSQNFPAAALEASDLVNLNSKKASP